MQGSVKIFIGLAPDPAKLDFMKEPTERKRQTARKKTAPNFGLVEKPKGF